ncbi:MAG: hypothetical protein GX957_04415 [Clostridiaceae bacterium]|nr:hypothetical protein [Clostridiaceae bacterium]
MDNINSYAGGRSVLKFESALIIVCALLPIIGHISILEFSILGVTLTLYRVFIPLIFLSLLCKRLADNTINIKSLYGRQYCKFVFALGFMFIYGLISLFISPMVDKRIGCLEIYNIGLGILSIAIIYEISLKKDGLIIYLKTLRVLVALSVLYGIFEIVTGYHLAFSRYSDPTFLSISNLENKTINLATGLYYNENDFSTFIGLFSFLFLPHKNYKTKINVMCIIIFMHIIIILSINDSWIVLIGVMLGLISYLVIMRAHIINWIISITIFFASSFGGTWIYIQVINLFNTWKFRQKVNLIISEPATANLPATGEKTVIPEKKTVISVDNVVNSQVMGALHKTGSLYYRLYTYLVSIKETIKQTYGLGFGPGSFSNFSKSLNTSKLLLNPHSLWIEIFTQYGMIVFFIFVAFLLDLFVKLYQELRKQEYTSQMVGMILALDITYVVVAFASSNWLNSPLIWLPIGLSLALICNSQTTKVQHKNN